MQDFASQSDAKPLDDGIELADSQPIAMDDDAGVDVGGLQSRRGLARAQWDGGLGANECERIHRDAAVHEFAHVQGDFEAVDPGKEMIRVLAFADGYIFRDQSTEGIDKKLPDADFHGGIAQGLLQGLASPKADSHSPEKVERDRNARENQHQREADRDFEKMVDGRMNPHRYDHIRCRGSISTATKTSSGIGRASRTERASRASRIEELPRSET